MEEKKKPTVLTSLRIYDPWLVTEYRLPREFATSAEAKAAGLQPGDVFRSGDTLKIVLED